MLFQQKGDLSIDKAQTSLEGSLPMFPPNTIIYGLKNIIVWPYLGSGFYPLIGTFTHLPFVSLLANFNKYNSLSTKLPWEWAPPNITN